MNKIKSIQLATPLKIMVIVAITLGLIFAAFIFNSNFSSAASSAKFPGTVAEDTTVGSASWTNYSNVTASDNSRATIESVGNYVTYYIKSTNFGFNIPTGATIDGILVQVEKQVGNGGTGNTKDNSIKLVKGGTISGDDKASASTWPANGAEANTNYGGSTDLWGLTWVPSDINASNFGVVVAAESTDGGTKNFEVDAIQITVYYTEGPVEKVVKTTSESTSSDTTLSDDAELDLTNLEANKTYIIDGVVFASSTSETPDLKLAFSVPAGAVMSVGYSAMSNSIPRNAEFLHGTGATDLTSSRIYLDDSSPTVIKVHGSVIMGSTAGDVTLKWAQAASDSSPVTIISGSYLRADNIEE